MAAKKKTSTKKTKPAPGDDIDLAGGPAAVDRFRKRALALHASAVKPLHGPARLIAHNVTIGANAVLAEKARLAAELPALDLASVRAVPALGLAVAWAAEEVVRFADEERVDVRALMRQAADLRGILLTNLDGAARAGLVPAAQVAKIRVGSGWFDTAGDCVACAALFKKFAAKLRGKTPVTAAQVNEAARVGAALQTALRPKGSKKKDKAQALKDAIALRDRLGTLLAADYDLVRRAGGWLFGEERDEKVPLPLASARGPRKKKGAVEESAATAQEAADAPAEDAAAEDAAAEDVAPEEKAAPDAKKAADAKPAAKKTAAKKTTPEPALTE